MVTNKQELLQKIQEKNPNEIEFFQAVKKFLDSIWEVYMANPRYVNTNLLERLLEPERTIIFRVPWENDKSEVNVNRGYRVEYNSARGPYKGGLRFHPNVNLSVLKFLGFEQIFKNSLTDLPLGGGKGGADFNSKGKSDNEIMHFCQSFMTELAKYIGAHTDIPAGDIGVGGREIGYLFGQYKRIKNEFTGVLSGKSIEYGGSLLRKESTGYGVVYFTQYLLKEKNTELKGKKIAVSGFGNVTWGVVKKINEYGAKVVTISGPDGFIYDEEGISEDKIDYLLELRATNNDVVEPYKDRFPHAVFHPNKKPWGNVNVDIAIPCAIHNEVDLDDVKSLIQSGCDIIIEASNMGCTLDAATYASHNITFAPSKAVNAGGVAVSGLEMSQNFMLKNWSANEINEKLEKIMHNIHKTCVKYGKENNKINYVKGANIGGFIKVANAMLFQGTV